MPLDSPLSATQFCLIPASFRHTLPSVPPSFQEPLCKGAHTSIWDDRPFTCLLSGMIALLSALAIFPRGALPGAACAPHKTSACLAKSWILILLFCPPPAA